MYSSKLRINTSLVADNIPSSVSPRDTDRPSLHPTRNISESQETTRPRARSNASTSSSISVVTPTSNSTNTSSSSVNLVVPQTDTSPDTPATYAPSPTSPSFLLALRGPEYVLAMHDYTPQQQNATCLSFRAGQVIHVINRDPSGWWDGELEGRRGWFPSNYVNADTGYMSDDSTHAARRSRRKRANAPVNRTPRPVAQAGISLKANETKNSDSFCAPLMVQLLSVFTVMQAAVRKKKTTHYLPSAAHIVKHVRNILSTTGTENKNAPVLQQHAILGQERKQLLQTLPPLINSAKKASAEPPGDAQDAAIENMMRCAVEVINRSRRFLIVGVHCGMTFPDTRSTDDSANWSLMSTNAESTQDSPSSTHMASASVDLGRTPTQQGKLRDGHATPGLSLRAKSLGNLRGGSSETFSANLVTPLPKRNALVTSNQNPQQTIPRHNTQGSISSTSSSNLTQELPPVAAPPSFPCGAVTARQILDAFTYTHDVFLSTTAAFIGQVHAYSHHIHASNKVKLCELGNEITDLACKLLILADAVLQHSGITKFKLDCLRSSQLRLFKEANILAEIVQSIAGSTSPRMDEEEEKGVMLRSATGSCKAGADCLSATRVCLVNKNTGQKLFVVRPVGTEDNMGKVTDLAPGLQTTPLAKGNPGLFGDDREDLTIQVYTPSPLRRLEEMSSSPKAGLTSRQCNGKFVTPFDHKSLTCIGIPDLPVEPDLASPTSLVRTEDGTTWEGSERDHDGAKLCYDESQSVPDLPVNPHLCMLSHDYAHDDVAYNSEGLLVGATLEALVEKMTPHDSIVDPAFSAVFFLTFRLFSTPLELTDAVIARYDLVPPAHLSTDDIALWEQRKGLPVRLRVSNFLKMWLEFYWRPGVDDPVLPRLASFVKTTLVVVFPGAAQRIQDLLDLRKRSPGTVSPVNDRIRDPGMLINPPTMPSMNTEIPRPTMTKTLLGALRRRDWTSIVVTDFDSLELARQLTIMECNLYCAIQPEEILELGQQGTKPLANVKAVTSLSTIITGWVAETVLNEPDIKKRSLFIKFFIKVADRCTSLNNFSTPRAILAALDSSTISRLHQTWLSVSQKHKTMLESMRRLADHGRNYHEYRTRLRNTAPPAVPFLGLYLTDLTFCREGNPSHRAPPSNPNKSLLNFNKYHKLARIVQDMQRFQVSYYLKEIPEVQEYLNVCFENSRHHGDLQDLYRRSLLVEPKQPTDSAALGDMRQLFNWATRSQSQATAS
ncbi:hypothetical protein AMATHDRAFT_73003 [Amanita thiersii Skay4041]|uniref:Ras GEF n=1 Tax=Amanita thiersii Skay4041 TaxID=703135 RepID=A0A2A9NTW4_9AGAR|nr:hypothetical protein AMATHDRAFT_73003 [Amanita thiersii Skay4041]